MTRKNSVSGVCRCSWGVRSGHHRLLSCVLWMHACLESSRIRSCIRPSRASTWITLQHVDDGWLWRTACFLLSDDCHSTPTIYSLRHTSTRSPAIEPPSISGGAPRAAAAAVAVGVLVAAARVTWINHLGDIQPSSML